MKRIITLVAVLAVSLPTVFAQGKPEGKDNGWQDKVRSEKIAFITAELQLTPEEAQVFWPVYNKYSEMSMNLGMEVRKAYKELEEALKENTDVEAKLDAYLKALEANTCHAEEAAAEYKKVISAEKVAKLYVAEEKFKFQQVMKLHNGGPNGGNEGGPGGPQPNGRRPGKGPRQPQPQPQPEQPVEE